LSVTAGGYGSRERARVALKGGKRGPKALAEPMDADEKNPDIDDNAIIDAQPLAVVVEPMQLESTPEKEKSVARLVCSNMPQLQFNSVLYLCGSWCPGLVWFGHISCQCHGMLIAICMVGSS
jgi:hypothetical protein